MSNEIYGTHDLYLSSVLIAEGFPLQKLEKNQAGKATFYFQQSGKLNAVVQGYWNQSLRINPNDLFNGLKFLKNSLYSGS